MSSDLSVPLHGRGALLQIHGLQQTVLAVFLSDAHHRALQPLLAPQLFRAGKHPVLQASALAHASINVRMIDQGSSEINIIVGIDEADYEKAVNALYSAFFK